MKLFFAATLLVFTIGCTTAKKATGYLDKHPDVAAWYCGEKFPPRDSAGEILYDTVFVDNKDWTGFLDSAVQAMEGIVAKAHSDRLLALQSHEACLEVVDGQEAEIKRLAASVGKVRTIYVPCKPDTIRSTQTIYRANTAKEKDLENKLAVVTAKLEDTQQDKSRWRLWCLITWGVIALYVVGRIRFKIPF